MDEQVTILCSEEELGRDQLRPAMAGDKRLMLCRLGDEVHALDAVCPHRGALLSQGELVKNAVVCPWHQWAFDLTTGQGITNPHSKLNRHSVSVRDGQVILEKPAESQS